MSASPSPAPPTIFGLKAATILGAVFLGLYALCVGLGLADQAHRAKLETLEPLPLHAQPPAVPQ